MKKTFGFGVALLFAVVANAQDTASYQGKAGVADVADSDPGLFVFMMIIMAGFLAAVVIGSVLTVLLAALLFLLSIAGMLSLSAIVGLYRRSVYSALKALVYMTFAAIGVGGAFLAYFLFSYVHINIHLPVNVTPLLLTAAAGIFGGLLCGRIFLAVSKVIVDLLTRKLARVTESIKL